MMSNESIHLFNKKTESEADKRKDSQTNTNEKSSNIVKGVLGACLWGLSNAISKICVQMLDNRVPHLQLNAWRFLISGCLISIYLISARTLSSIENNNIVSSGLYAILDVSLALVKYIPVVYIALATTEVFYITFMILTSLIIFGIIKRNKQELFNVSNIFSINSE